MSIQEVLKLWKEGYMPVCEIDDKKYAFITDYDENLEIPIRMIERGKWSVENK